MAINVGTIMADAGMNMRGFTGALSTMYKEGAKTAKSIEQRFQRIGGKMQSIGGSMTAGLTLPLAAAGGMALKTAAKYERLEMQLSTLVGSAEKGGKIFEQLKEFSAGTPFQIQDLVKANNTLIGMGQNSEDAFSNLQMLGDVASATGANVNELAITFGQASAEGRLMTRDIREFISRGVPMTKMLADSMGVAKSEIFDLASQGRITFDVLQKALSDATSGTGRYAGATEAMANTLTGVWSTFTDNVGQMAGQIGTDLVEAFDLKDLLKSVTSGIKQMTDWFSSLSSTTKKVIFGITGLVAAVGPLALGLGTIVSLMPTLIAGFAALTSPISLTIGAVGALAAAAGYLYSNWDAVKDSMNRIWISMKNAIVEFVADSMSVLQRFFAYLPGMGSVFGQAEAYIRSFKSEMPSPEDAIEFKGFGESMGNVLEAITGSFSTANEKAQKSAKGIIEAARTAASAGEGGASGAVDIGFVSSIDTFGVSSEQLETTNAKLTETAGTINTVKQATIQAANAGRIWGQSIGHSLSQAAFQGARLLNVVKDLIVQFAKKLFVKGISLLVGGGFGGTIAGFGKGLFGGLFHSGGIVPGSGDRMVRVSGGEGVFTQGQMRALGAINNSSGPSLSARDMESAFERALNKTMRGLGPEEIFAMAQKGRMGY